MEKELRRISIGELKLMFTRLVIKVQEEPEMFKDSKSGVDAFFYGEDKRRELLVDKEELEYIRLEYCEKQGLFHFENPDKDNENTYGWETICPKMLINQCEQFCYYIGDIRQLRTEKFTATEVKEEFEKWLLT